MQSGSWVVTAGQRLERKLAGQLEQGVLNHLLGGTADGPGDTVVKAGGDRVQADQKFLQSAAPLS